MPFQANSSRCGVIVLMRTLVFLALPTDSSQYPNCTEQSFRIASDTSPALVRVYDYLDDGALIDPPDESCAAMDSGCDSFVDSSLLNHSFRVNGTDACGIICFRSGQCDWWMSELIGLNHTMCSLFRTHNALSVNGSREESSPITTGHKSCSTSKWPACIEDSAWITTAGYAELWINATMVLNIPELSDSCTKSNCSFTDKFSSDSVEECASVCSRIPHCKHWSFGSNTCHLRTTRVKTQLIHGIVSGDRECARGSPWSPPRGSDL